MLESLGGLEPSGHCELASEGMLESLPLLPSHELGMFLLLLFVCLD